MVKLEELIDDLVTQESGALNLMHLWEKLGRQVNDDEFEEFLKVISTDDKIKTIIMSRSSPLWTGATKNKNLERFLVSIRNNKNINHLVFDCKVEFSPLKDDDCIFNLLIFAISNPNLNRLSFPYNEIEGANIGRFRIFFNAINVNVSITHLDLSHNGIGYLDDEKVLSVNYNYLSTFVQFIENNKSLRFLNLSDNKMFAGLSMYDISKALAKNKSLECIDLTWNGLGLLNEHLDHLIEAVTKNEKILCVKITPQALDVFETQNHHLSPERLKLLHEVLHARVSPITHLGHSTVRALKNITVKDCKLGKTLPLGVVKKILTFCPLHKKLSEQAFDWEFSKPPFKSASNNARIEAQKKKEVDKNGV